MPSTITPGYVRILMEGEDSAHVSAGWHTTPVEEDGRLFVLVDMSDHKCQKVCNPRMVEELKRLRAVATHSLMADQAMTSVDPMADDDCGPSSAAESAMKRVRRANLIDEVSKPVEVCVKVGDTGAEETVRVLTAAHPTSKLHVEMTTNNIDILGMAPASVLEKFRPAINHHNVKWQSYRSSLVMRYIGSDGKEKQKSVKIPGHASQEFCSKAADELEAFRSRHHHPRRSDATSSAAVSGVSQNAADGDSQVSLGVNTGTSQGELEM